MAIKTGTAAAGNEKIFLWRGETLCIVLAQEQIFFENPGLGTPAMVYLKTKDGEVCSTYWYWEGEGNIDGYEVTDVQRGWLDSFSEFVYNTTDAWYDLDKKKIAK